MADRRNGDVEEDRVSLITTLSTHPAPDTVTSTSLSETGQRLSDADLALSSVI